MHDACQTDSGYGKTGKSWYFHSLWKWGRNGWSFFVQPSLYSRNCISCTSGTCAIDFLAWTISILYNKRCTCSHWGYLGKPEHNQNTNLEKILLDTVDARSQCQHQSILRKTCKERKQEMYTKYSQGLATVGGDERTIKTSNILTWTFHLSSSSSWHFPYLNRALASHVINPFNAADGSHFIKQQWLLFNFYTSFLWQLSLMLTFSFLLSFRRHLLLGKVILYTTFTFSFISYTDVEDYLAQLIFHI